MDYNFFLLYKYQKKTSTYYQRNRQKLLNRAKEYYGNNKEWLTEQIKNIDNYLMKGKIKRENIREEIDIKICLKKINKY